MGNKVLLLLVLLWHRFGIHSLDSTFPFMITWTALDCFSPSALTHILWFVSHFYVVMTPNCFATRHFVSTFCWYHWCYINLFHCSGHVIVLFSWFCRNWIILEVRRFHILWRGRKCSWSLYHPVYIKLTWLEIWKYCAESESCSCCLLGSLPSNDTHIFFKAGTISIYSWIYSPVSCIRQVLSDCVWWLRVWLRTLKRYQTNLKRLTR